MLDTATIDCPYCGERIEVVLDPSLIDAEYVEDCEVCCRPLVITASFDEDATFVVRVRTENE